MRFHALNSEIESNKPISKLIPGKTNCPVLFNIIQYDELHYAEHNFKFII